MASERPRQRGKSEQCVDSTVEDSFPASDPPSYSGVTGAGGPANRSGKLREATEERGDNARPTGTPTSDRHAAETAHQWEDEGGRRDKA
jgi:hypothetical protein